MNISRELEMISHTTMNCMEIFLVAIESRSPHGHDDLEIGLILDGRITLFLDQTPYVLQKGDIYLINRYQIHSLLACSADPSTDAADLISGASASAYPAHEESAQTDSPVESQSAGASSPLCGTATMPRQDNGSHESSSNLILAFQIHTDLYRSLNYQLTYLQFESNIIRSGHLHARLTELLFSCARVYFSDQPFKELDCCSFFLHAFSLLLESSPCTIASEREYHMVQGSTARINHISEYIAEHYSEQIRLADIAELENISVCHASHFFRKAFGVTFQDYVNNVRFEHALPLLRRTDLTLLDICMESGFSSTRYLNEMCRKRLGCTARAVRANQNLPELQTTTVLPVSSHQKRYTYEQSASIITSCRPPVRVVSW